VPLQWKDLCILQIGEKVVVVMRSKKKRPGFPVALWNVGSVVVSGSFAHVSGGFGFDLAALDHTQTRRLLRSFALQTEATDQLLEMLGHPAEFACRGIDLFDAGALLLDRGRHVLCRSRDFFGRSAHLFGSGGGLLADCCD